MKIQSLNRGAITGAFHVTSLEPKLEIEVLQQVMNPEQIYCAEDVGLTIESTVLNVFEYEWKLDHYYWVHHDYSLSGGGGIDNDMDVDYTNIQIADMGLYENLKPGFKWLAGIS